jgi:hypothetical protein
MCLSWLYSSPPSFSLIPLPTFLGQFQQVSLFYFYTCIQSTLTIFTLLLYPPPSHQIPPLYRTCFTILFFIILGVPSFSRGFHLVFHTCTCTLIRLTPTITYSYSITLLPDYSTAFSTFCYTIFMPRCNVFHIFMLSFSFPHLPPPSHLRQTCY